MLDQTLAPGARAEPGAEPRAPVAWLLLYRPSLVAVWIGLLLTLVAAVGVWRWQQRVARAEFEGVAATELVVLQTGIDEYLSRMVALRTLFESSNDEVTRSEFEAFSGRLFENHPGLLRVGWLPKVLGKERSDYEMAAANDGVAGYQIKAFSANGAISTAPSRDQYFPVFFSTEPKTSMVYGLDYSSEPTRWQTLERSRDQNTTAAMPIRLIYDLKQHTHGVLASVPVYVKGTSRTTIADRRRNLNGFVVGIIDLEQLLGSILASTAASSAVDINVYMPEAGPADGARDVFTPYYASAPAAPQSIEAFTSGPHWSGMLSIGDSYWRVAAIPAAGGRLVAGYDRALGVLTLGLVITLCIAFYLALASRNAHQIAEVNRRVLELARTDGLTQLPNRRVFLEQLDEAVNALGHRDRFAVLILGLDRFKNINETLGHSAGDSLLREVARRLKAAVRSTDLLARLGGDEFAIIQSGHDAQIEAARDLATVLCRSIAEPIALMGRQLTIGSSIGITLAPEHGSDRAQLLKKADLALHRSKTSGGSRFTFYDETMSAELEARASLESDLRDAVARAQFELHYQPLFDVQSGERLGFEALVRWRHPVRGLVPPDAFIPMAEATGLIVPLGEWVLRQACQDATRWPGEFKVAVNLSPLQFRQADLLEVIQSALRTTGLSPDRLELELTESALLEQESENEAVIHKLKTIGISLALDDFGTGYSSLSRLTAFPFDKIKIDKSFIRNLSLTKSSAIVSSVVTLARGLDMSVTAEGIETSEQFERLRTLGVNFGQGYLLGRPVPFGELDFQPLPGRACEDAA